MIGVSETGAKTNCVFVSALLLSPFSSFSFLLSVRGVGGGGGGVFLTARLKEA